MYFVLPIPYKSIESQQLVMTNDYTQMIMFCLLAVKSDLTNNIILG